MASLGYGEIADALSRGENPRDALARVIVLTQQYAKRQETFFRSVENAVWIDMTHADADDRARVLVGDFLRLATPQ
jgi:tRNA A37 N6-isopentenylltransferase MiaA